MKVAIADVSMAIRQNLILLFVIKFWWGLNKVARSLHNLIVVASWQTYVIFERLQTYEKFKLSGVATYISELHSWIRNTFSQEP